MEKVSKAVSVSGGAGAEIGVRSGEYGPIATCGAVRLYGDHVAQSTPKHFKTLALLGVEYCHWERHRYTGLAAPGFLTGGAALGILVATFGDGRTYWIPVWMVLAGVSIFLLTAYFDLSSGVMTIRSMHGSIVETCGTRQTAMDFLNNLMAARQRVAETQEAEIARAVEGGADSCDPETKPHKPKPATHQKPVVTK